MPFGSVRFGSVLEVGSSGGTEVIESQEISYVDDCVHSSLDPDPAALVSRICAVLAVVDEVLCSYRFSLNYGKNKTAIVLALRGSGAKRMRQDIFCSEEPCLNVPTCNGTRKVYVVPTYRHLGTVFSSNNSQTPETINRPYTYPPGA